MKIADKILESLLNKALDKGITVTVKSDVPTTPPVTSIVNNSAGSGMTSYEEAVESLSRPIVNQTPLNNADVYKATKKLLSEQNVDLRKKTTEPDVETVLATDRTDERVYFLSGVLVGIGLSYFATKRLLK